MSMFKNIFVFVFVFQLAYISSLNFQNSNIPTSIIAGKESFVFKEISDTYTFDFVDQSSSFLISTNLYLFNPDVNLKSTILQTSSQPFFYNYESSNIVGFTLYIFKSQLYIDVYSSDSNFDTYVIAEKTTFIKEKWYRIELIIQDRLLKCKIDDVEFNSINLNQKVNSVFTDRLIVGNGINYDVLNGALSNFNYYETDNNIITTIKKTEGSIHKTTNLHGIDYLTIKQNLTKYGEYIVYLDFAIDNNKFESIKNIICLTDGKVESQADWKFVLNYDNNDGLSVHVKNNSSIMSYITNYSLKTKHRNKLALYVAYDNISLYINGEELLNKNIDIDFLNKYQNLYIGAGVLKNSYFNMNIYDFKVNNFDINRNENISSFFTELTRNVFLKEETNKLNQVKYDLTYIKYSAITFASTSILSTFLAPVFFISHNINFFTYNSLLKMYDQSKNQEEIDIYYSQLKDYSNYSNIFLVAGITMIPLSIISLTGAIISFYMYSNNNIDKKVKLNFQKDFNELKISFGVEF